jgi:hypothetical protein
VRTPGQTGLRVCEIFFFLFCPGCSRTGLAPVGCVANQQSHNWLWWLPCEFCFWAQSHSQGRPVSPASRTFPRGFQSTSFSPRSRRPEFYTSGLFYARFFYWSTCPGPSGHPPAADFFPSERNQQGFPAQGSNTPALFPLPTGRGFLQRGASRARAQSAATPACQTRDSARRQLCSKPRSRG